MKKEFVLVLAVSCLLFFGSYLSCNVFQPVRVKEMNLRNEFTEDEATWFFIGIWLFSFGLTILAVGFISRWKNRK